MSTEADTRMQRPLDKIFRGDQLQSGRLAHRFLPQQIRNLRVNLVKRALHAGVCFGAHSFSPEWDAWDAGCHNGRLTSGHSLSLTKSITGRNAPHLYYQGK